MGVELNQDLRDSTVRELVAANSLGVEIEFLIEKAIERGFAYGVLACCDKQIADLRALHARLPVEGEVS